MSELRDNEKLYAERDPMAQDEAGGYFARHMHHMTTENLHSKAEIAEELAHRDIQIEAKDQRIAELSRVLQMCGEAVNSVPADTFGLGTLTDAQGEEQVYPLRDELSQEIITVLASEDTRKEAGDD